MLRVSVPALGSPPQSFLHEQADEDRGEARDGQIAAGCAGEEPVARAHGEQADREQQVAPRGAEAVLLRADLEENRDENQHGRDHQKDAHRSVSSCPRRFETPRGCACARRRRVIIPTPGVLASRMEAQ